MNPPKLTVGRKALIALCDAAGAGAEVKFDLEVQDRAGGRGVTGTALQIVRPANPAGAERPMERMTRDPMATPDGTLSFEEVVALFEAEGGRPGKTATADGKWYDVAHKLRYVPCLCSFEDPTSGCREYIAKTSRGTPYYIGRTLKTGLITCGPKGYHYHRPDVPVCI